VRRYRPRVHEGGPAAAGGGWQKPAAGRHRPAVRPADQELHALYQAHYRALTRLAALLVGDLAAAEDIVQDAFVAMHRTWCPPRTRDQALLYLHRKVVRRARSRRPARRGKPGRTPQWHMPGSPAAARALAILATLPVRQREALVLRYWAGLSGTQIAAVTGARPQAVTSSLAKGLARLAGAAQPDHDAAARPYPAGPSST
jgi:DNA-directed RNA polymerase specialized sigma24 family protein